MKYAGCHSAEMVNPKPDIRPGMPGNHLSYQTGQGQISHGNYRWMQPQQIRKPGATKTLTCDALQRSVLIEVRNSQDPNKLLTQRRYRRVADSRFHARVTLKRRCDFPARFGLTRYCPLRHGAKENQPLECKEYEYSAADSPS